MAYEHDLMWKGEFGDAYTKRNNVSQIVPSNIHLFSKIISHADGGIDSILEFGSNIGLNLIALSYLLPHVDDISAIEINENAAKECQQNVNIKNMYIQSINEFTPDYKRDFVLAKGILIYMSDYMDEIYEKLYQSSKKYICICEYYNPTPVEVKWRGQSNMLIKRDFCGEMMNKYPDLKLVDYGFIYHRDHNFPQDDINWFLLKK